MFGFVDAGLWQLILLVLIVFSLLTAFRKKPPERSKGPRTRCTSCGAVYYGHKCPMCGDDFSNNVARPRTRCSACGEVYYGDICPMCGTKF